MKKLLGGLLSCILGGWLLTACTSDDDLQQIRKLHGNHHKKRRKRSRATMEIQRNS